MKVLIDTYGWIALLDPREARHQEVKNCYQQLKNKKAVIITTDYILDETITLLYRRLPAEVAQDALASLEKAVKKELLQLEWINSEHFTEALALRKKLIDKPNISFTDLTSMIVIKEMNINYILTDDHHFLQVGLSVQNLP